MSVVLTQEMPGATRDLIEQITREMHFERTGAPAGLIVHTATESEDGIRIVDIWETAEAYTTFEKTRLQPAIEAVAARNGLDLTMLPTMRPSIDDAFDIVLP